MADESRLLPKVRPLQKLQGSNHNEIEKDLEGFFSNNEQLRWFVFLMRGYTERFETAQALCMRILGHKRVCYLVDFDVIRNYLEMKSLANVDTFTVDFLFLDSKTSFAIPIGAFEELLRYLSGLSKKSFRLNIALTDCNREEAIRLIGDALDIKDSKELKVEELSEEIAYSLGKSILVLTRLLGLLTNPRFEGVKSQYDETCYEAWLNAVEKSRRTADPKPRSDVDRRDAMNLAVASRNLFPRKALKSGAWKDEHVCYLLVSQTRAVLQLIPDTEGEEIENVTNYFDVDIIVLRGIYPAVHPQDAMVVELLGGADNPTVALTRIQSRALDFRQLADHLQNQYVFAMTAPPEELKELYVEAFGSFILQERKQIQEEIKKISEGLLTVENELRLVEETRATIESEDQAQLRQVGVDPHSEDELRVKSLHFSRLLGEIIEALEVTPGAEYGLQVSNPQADVPFARFEIGPVPHASGGIETFLWGELYPWRETNLRAETYEYFALRWSIVCLEEDMIHSFVNAWEIVDEATDVAQPVPLVRIDNGHEYWKQGLIVQTSAGDYGMLLEIAACGGSWEWLSLRKLGPLVKEAAGQNKAPDGRNTVPNIMCLRVNTACADVIYDVRVAPDMRRRHLTVLSHYNISGQIADLYKKTGLLFCNQPKLAEVLDKCLKGFRQYMKANTARGTE